MEVLVVFVILIVLAGTAVPVSKSLKTKANAVNCSKNLRQIGHAVMLYASDNQMVLPATSHQRGGKSWTKTLQPYAGENTLVFRCAEDENKSRAYSYTINDFLTPNPAGADHLNFSVLSRIDRPDETFMFAETTVSQTSDHFHFAAYYGGKVPPPVFSYQVQTEAHDGGANYLFADGHVETLKWNEVQTRLSADGSRFLDPSGGVF